MWNKYSRKLAIIGLAALVIIVLMLLMVPALAAHDEHPHNPGYVGIQKGSDYCWLLDGNKNFEHIHRSLAKINVSYNPKENIILQCDFIVDSSEEGGAELWDSGNTDYNCYVYKEGEPEPIGNTTQLNWKIVVSANGNARLTCHFETADDIGG